MVDGVPERERYKDSYVSPIDRDCTAGLVLEVLAGAGIPGIGGRPRTSIAHCGDSTSLYVLRVSL